jgi:predicted transcriptional regulator
VTAKVTDRAGNNVPDGTLVTFKINGKGVAAPAIAVTSFGSVATVVTPDYGAMPSVVIEVVTGTRTASIQIDCVAPVSTLFLRSAWRVLTALLEPPFIPHQQKEIARSLDVPEATVQRGLRALMDTGLAQRKRRQYVISVGQQAVRYLWLLFQAERYAALPYDLANSLSIIMARDFTPDDCVILFGSWARGVAIRGESDVDVAVFTAQSDRIGSRRAFEGPHRFDIQTWDIGELRQPTSSAALDALLNGVPVTARDAVYDVLLDLRSFPKAFLLYRLEQASLHLFSAELEDESSEARALFSDLAQRIVGQVRNILEHGRTRSWRETPVESSPRKAIAELGARLAREGDQIWLT